MEFDINKILDGGKKEDPETEQVNKDLDDIKEYRAEIIDELFTKVAELDLQLEEISRAHDTTVGKLKALIKSKEALLTAKKHDLIRLQSKLVQEQSKPSHTPEGDDREEEAMSSPKDNPIQETPSSSPQIPEDDGEPKIVVMIFNDGVTDEAVKHNEDLCEGWINRYKIPVEKMVKLTSKNNLFGIRTKLRNAGVFHRMNQGCIFASANKEALTPIVNGMCKIE